jgi:predicted O-methyltransferase YrrM
MASRRLMECLISHKPYFGPALRALQGVSKRQAYLQAVVELLSREKHAKPIKILEVGSWAGASAITWAKAVQKYFGSGRVVCVDHWRPYFDTRINSEPVYVKMNEAAIDGSIYRLFLHNVRTSGVGALISPLIGGSRNVLPTLKKDNFFIVYLDASHHFPDVQEDIKLSVSLLKEGGIICGDDLELQMSEVGTAELTKDVATDKDYVKSETCGIFYHPGVTRAVAEAFGEVSAWEGFWAMRKTKGGWTKVDLSGCKIEIPEHISTAELYPPVPSDDRKRLVFSINQIAEQLAKAEQESGGLAQDVPKALGSYCGFNIVRLNEYYYGVHQSLGEIDWSLAYSDLVNRYGESALFRCSDKNAIIARISLNEILDYVEKLSSVIAEALLRQEAVLNGVPGIARESSDHPQLLKEDYRGFNLIAYDGKIWAAAMAVGPIDLRDVAVRERLMAEGRLLEAITVDGARAAIDARLLEERVHAMEIRLDEINALRSEIKLSKQAAQDTGGELDRLRGRVSEFESTLVRICAEFRQSVGRTKSNLVEQIGDLKQNTLLRLRSYVTRKIKKGSDD